MDDFQNKYYLLLAQNEELRKENAELKTLLNTHGIEYNPKHKEVTNSVCSAVSFPEVKLSLDERVSLFQSLFKGREDVFARRWFSQTTMKGGLPAWRAQYKS